LPQRPGPGLDWSRKIALSDIAEKFIEYYSRQAIPYAPGMEQGDVLKQNTGKQAAIINAIVAFRNHFLGSIQLARRDAPVWKKLVAKVAGTIKDKG
jgi:hypothetical protein